MMVGETAHGDRHFLLPAAWEGEPRAYWLISGSTSFASLRSDSCQPR